MKNYLMDIDELKNNIATIEQHWDYLKDKVIYCYDDKVNVKELFLNSNFSLKMSLDYIKKYIDCDENFDFYLKQKNNNKNIFSIKILNNNKEDIYNKCKIICPRCKKKYIIKKQQKLYFRKEHLFCYSCICHYAQTIGNGQKKFEETMLKKYGVKRPIQDNKIRKKTEKTMTERYGAKYPLQSDIIKKKIADTMLERYSVINPFESEIFQKKGKETLKNKYGDSNIWNTDIVKKILNSGKCCVSKVSYNFFDELSKRLSYKCMYGENEKRLNIDNKIYFLDFYIDKINFVIEFQGDFFHANPIKYKKDDLVLFGKNKKTAQKVWEDDKKRKEIIEKFLNCSILYVWENDIALDKEKEINRIIGIINNVKYDKGD